ncbi:MAG: Na+/H+ antiporter NhaA [Sphingobacteriia bacterium 24-36-13]|jgi:NhaA family Na+:H+ antiporter|uniref:Na+/H+ antiporter NhaA n=1 Tax=Sediminibacterium sp. TaxID=1917865 RepID=UPI000BDD0CD6|nr:Na+/H+ antiporter NhaA [Sediminibacterium sp.]OYY08665.1 MAG: Na+/H+ antiporter NhaA [Sphingobacteriia bacterium 35-36-14]OYZ54756.1 MAG: Na+/H+ antiporter NhaA [Sphingobacteriia bacterium 24-36-13]OZA62143.1 MAG: Na+/H+ antiporter NhaA [Sphingobacteriia bacterium 39-39-8]HQS23328.1 Na+/H+ antiporter NhaA [Sediminibacterium sp.]HQS36431.1 Na+/H+ antiporter NhaA [Sediminibacterium sp.]
MAARKLVKKVIIDPLITFIHDSKSIGIVLLIATTLSILLANISSISSNYISFFHWSIDGTDHHSFEWGVFHLPNSILVIINDLFMAAFFFIAGMEIKRELVAGELASIKQSILPVVAAIGGMLIPALIYSQFSRGTTYMNGWAIPMATDIAFTLGIASLLGNRVPVALKIFITALAIIDDLGAIVVIALFYGGQLKLLYLLLSTIIMIILLSLQKNKVKIGWYTWVLGLALWYTMFNSGIHATVAGVLFAFTIPVKKLAELELSFHTPVYFIIMPLFALANTAIVFPEEGLAALNHSFSWGIMAGLFIGKPLGICLACYWMIKQKWANLPSQTNWHQLIGAGILAGIGFTMSIFISMLAFDENIVQDIAKIAVLISSVLSMIVGYIWLAAKK